MLKILLASLPIIYIFFVIFMVGLIHCLTIKRRKSLLREKFPLEKDLKILREPGESQRKFVDEMFEKLLGEAILGALFVFELTLLPLQLAGWLKLAHDAQIKMLIVSAILIVVGSILLIVWLSKKLNEIRNRQLGCFGERVVGEWLNNLKSEGYFVFHDLPMDNEELRHNIDHVVVGRSGIFAVETKTYRKRKGKSGLEDHEIVFRGDRLVFPWTKLGAESKKELTRAKSKATWLTNRISKTLGSHIEVQPILVFPGWYVKSEVDWPMVLSHKRLCPYILRQKNSQLSDGQITNIARFLESRCRDVEY